MRIFYPFFLFLLWPLALVAAELSDDTVNALLVLLNRGQINEVELTSERWRSYDTVTGNGISQAEGATYVARIAPVESLRENINIPLDVSEEGVFSFDLPAGKLTPTGYSSGYIPTEIVQIVGEEEEVLGYFDLFVEVPAYSGPTGAAVLLFSEVQKALIADAIVRLDYLVTDRALTGLQARLTESGQLFDFLSGTNQSLAALLLASQGDASYTTEEQQRATEILTLMDNIAYVELADIAPTAVQSTDFSSFSYSFGSTTRGSESVELTMPSTQARITAQSRDGAEQDAIDYLNSAPDVVINFVKDTAEQAQAAAFSLANKLAKRGGRAALIVALGGALNATGTVTVGAAFAAAAPWLLAAGVVYLASIASTRVIQRGVDSYTGGKAEYEAQNGALDCGSSQRTAAFARTVGSSISGLAELASNAISGKSSTEQEWFASLSSSSDLTMLETAFNGMESNSASDAAVVEAGYCEEVLDDAPADPLSPLDPGYVDPATVLPPEGTNWTGCLKLRTESRGDCGPPWSGTIVYRYVRNDCSVAVGVGLARVNTYIESRPGGGETLILFPGQEAFNGDYCTGNGDVSFYVGCDPDSRFTDCSDAVNAFLGR
jgi:hypothetical protein